MRKLKLRNTLAMVTRSRIFAALKRTTLPLCCSAATSKTMTDHYAQPEIAQALGLIAVFKTPRFANSFQGLAS